MKDDAKKKAIDNAAESLISGQVGTYEYIDDFENDDYLLVRTEQGYCSGEEEWECAEYHLLNKSTLESHYIALCDGYNGWELKMSTKEIAALVGGNGIDIKDYITSYNITGDWIAAAKEAEIVEADEDFEGECRVWITYCYSSGTLGHPNDDFARDDDGDTITFDDYAAASKWVDAQTSGTYYLSHGEMDAPSYKIVEA